MTPIVSKDYKFTPAERIIVSLVMARPKATLDAITETLWPDPDDMPDTWIDTIRQHIYTARKKMLLTGWTITGCAKRGWHLQSSENGESK